MFRDLVVAEAEVCQYKNDIEENTKLWAIETRKHNYVTKLSKTRTLKLLTKSLYFKKVV